jgi:hypothetical protein
MCTTLSSFSEMQVYEQDDRHVESALGTVEGARRAAAKEKRARGARL